MLGAGALAVVDQQVADLALVLVQRRPDHRRVGEGTPRLAEVSSHLLGVILPRLVGRRPGCRGRGEVRTLLRNFTGRDRDVALMLRLGGNRFRVDPETLVQVGHDMLTIQWQDGEKVIVAPEEAANGDVIYPANQ